MTDPTHLTAGTRRRVERGGKVAAAASAEPMTFSMGLNRKLRVHAKAAPSQVKTQRHDGESKSRLPTMKEFADREEKLTKVRAVIIPVHETIVCYSVLLYYTCRNSREAME
jgi:hypothetical protein